MLRCCQMSSSMPTFVEKRSSCIRDCSHCRCMSQHTNRLGQKTGGEPGGNGPVLKINPQPWTHRSDGCMFHIFVPCWGGREKGGITVSCIKTFNLTPFSVTILLRSPLIIRIPEETISHSNIMCMSGQHSPVIIYLTGNFNLGGKKAMSCRWRANGEEIRPPWRRLCEYLSSWVDDGPGR